MKTSARKQLNASEHLARKFAEYVPLTPEERLIVSDLTSDLHHVPRRQDLLIEGHKSNAVFLLTEGFLMRYRILRDGRRQVVSMIIPGDFAGVPGCFFDGALYSVKAMTDSIVAAIPIHDLCRLFATHSRLAAKIFWSFSCDAAIYAEHLVVVGRRTALERVAHFLLELLTRLQAVGLVDRCSYQLPLSQELVGDALGLSPGSVNRVIRQLTEDGLVTFSGQKVIINDIEALSTMADFERGYLKPIPVPEFADPITVGSATPGEIIVLAPVMYGSRKRRHTGARALVDLAPAAPIG